LKIKAVPNAAFATWLLIAGIAVCALWVANILLPESARNLGSGRVCFAEVGQSNDVMPALCVTGEARAPKSGGTVVILSRVNLARFLKFLNVQEHTPLTARTEVGSYEIRDTIQPDRELRILSKAQMRAVIERLMHLLDSAYRMSEEASLNDLLNQLNHEPQRP
jgi:hypothetical protein